MKPGSGVVLVHKPKGPTSHDIVAQARRLLGTRRIGHAGTLDPMAEGLLLLLVGEATKLSNLLGGMAKRYRARIEFGLSTDTDDAMGRPLQRVSLLPGWLDEALLREALDNERARRSQLPPTVSAIKIDGVAAHKLHRRGAEVPLLPRPIRVHSLGLLERGGTWLELEMEVSKGYYVRSLARDLGRTLKIPAHLATLCRCTSGPFSLAEAVPWPLDVSPPLLAMGEIARRVTQATLLSTEGTRLARSGLPIPPSEQHDLTPGPEVCVGSDDAPIACLDHSGNLVALAHRQEGNRLVVVRGFSDPAVGREP